jgi:hypothetical protein
VRRPFGWALIFFLVASSSSCTKPSPPPPTTGWPSLPATDEEARKLFPPLADAASAPSNDNVADLLATALDRGELRAGEAAIETFIDEQAKKAGATKRFYLLWGTHHDSAAQVELFRRVTGLTAKTHFTHVVLEQLRANGYWSGIPATEQRGDDDALSRFRREGARAALDEIRLAQERDDYAAWKYGYIGSILDIVAEARGDHDVLGCDMPLKVQSRLLPAVRETWGNSLRELHCALALKSRITLGDARVAMLWGGQHVSPGGVQRFLPPNAQVTSLQVIGRRAEDDPVARAIYERFELVEPVLLEAAGIVILPEKPSSPHFERKRDHDHQAAGDVIVSSPKIRVDRKNHVLSVPLAAKNRTLIAPLVLPCEVHVDDEPPEVTLTVHD